MLLLSFSAFQVSSSLKLELAFLQLLRFFRHHCLNLPYGFFYSGFRHYWKFVITMLLTQCISYNCKFLNSLGQLELVS